MIYQWSKLKVCHTILLSFFCVSVWIDVINEKLLGNIIPTEICNYTFWLSLGLYAGFHICLYLIRKEQGYKN